MRTLSRRMVAVSVCAALGVALLAALGVWQIERRTWKWNLIATVDQRVHAAPVDAPPPQDWPAITTEHDQYRRIRATGAFLNDRETLVQAVTERGSGFWVITPLRTDAGFTVLVNRGFVPPEQRAPASRAAGEISGPTTVVGLLRISEPQGGFLRSNDPAQDRWYSRDVPAIAAARGLSDVAPYFIDADARPGPPLPPFGGMTVIAFPNSHLVYAITWFTLALMLAGASGYTLRDEWRRTAARRRQAGAPGSTC